MLCDVRYRRALSISAYACAMRCPVQTCSVTSCLRTCYAMPVLTCSFTSCLCACYEMSATYARAMRCPVLTHSRMPVGRNPLFGPRAAPPRPPPPAPPRPPPRPPPAPWAPVRDALQPAGVGREEGGEERRGGRREEWPALPGVSEEGEEGGSEGEREEGGRGREGALEN
eukprot:1789371-Rhodomonas_salina.2